MTPRPSLAYPSAELSLLSKLENLFIDWKTQFIQTHGSSELDADGIVCDGFYPYYLNQPYRILFVGREALEIVSLNYLNVQARTYVETKRVGDGPNAQHLNSSKFHSRLLHISHGIIHGMIPWGDIPDADIIGDTFATDSGISFAFMNMSKLSNESGEWKADWDLIDKSIRQSISPRNFIEEEIALLQPQIVITMGLGTRLHALGQVEPISEGPALECYWLTSGSNRALLLNTFHFSAYGKDKDDVTDFYQPICEAIKQHL